MSGETQAATTERPIVLNDLSTTQVDELTRQFSDMDRIGWDRLCQEYGWSPEDCDATWIWFSRTS